MCKEVLLCILCLLNFVTDFTLQKLKNKERPNVAMKHQLPLHEFEFYAPPAAYTLAATVKS